MTDRLAGKGTFVTIAVHLADDESASTTGAVFVVDGGITM